MADGLSRGHARNGQQSTPSNLGLSGIQHPPSPHSSIGNSLQRKSLSSRSIGASSFSAILAPPLREPFQPFSLFPPHPTQLHPRFSPQVAASLAAAAARRRRQCLLSCVFLGASLCALLYCAMSVPAGLSLAAAGGTVPRDHPSQSPAVLAGLQPDRVSFVVIIDAGSSGSRVHVVPFHSPAARNASAMPAILPDRMASLKLRPGLSSLEHMPAAAEESLAPLLEFAKTKVPPGQWASTPIRLMATAGLRRLPPGPRDAILRACQAALEASPFATPQGSAAAALISGKWEGAFAWVAANYAAGTLGHAGGSTLGVVEMGGASVQVCFSPASPPPDAFLMKLDLPARSYSLYCHSFLHYGQDAAQAAVDVMVDALRRGAPLRPLQSHGEATAGATAALAGGGAAAGSAPRSSRAFAPSALTSPPSSSASASVALSLFDIIAEGHPCRPLDSPALKLPPPILGALHSLSSPPASSPRSSFSSCSLLAHSFIESGTYAARGAPLPPCSPYNCSVAGSVFVPELAGDFVATENFFFTVKFLGLPVRPSLADVERAGERFCRRDFRLLPGAGAQGLQPRRRMLGSGGTDGTAGSRQEQAGAGGPQQAEPTEMRGQRVLGAPGGTREQGRAKQQRRVTRQKLRVGRDGGARALPSPSGVSSGGSVPLPGGSRGGSGAAGGLRFETDRRQASHAAAAAAGNAESVARYCFSSAYIVAFLKHVLRVGAQERRVSFTNEVGGFSVEWAIGAAILQAASSLGSFNDSLFAAVPAASDSSRSAAAAAETHSSTPRQPSTLSAFSLPVFLLSVCALVALALGVLAARHRRLVGPLPTTIYDLERGGRYLRVPPAQLKSRERARSMYDMRLGSVSLRRPLL